jgi:hypothetical protein
MHGHTSLGPTRTTLPGRIFSAAEIHDFCKKAYHISRAVFRVPHARIAAEHILSMPSDISSKPLVEGRETQIMHENTDYL